MSGRMSQANGVRDNFLSILPESQTLCSDLLPKFEKNTWKRSLRIWLPHVGLVLFSLFYILIGACIFYLIESHEERSMRQKAEVELNTARRQLLNAVWNEDRMNRSAWEANVGVYVENATRIVIGWYNRRYTTDQTVNTWTYPTAIFFAISMITTIGYGNLVPSTTEGQVICIIYGIFGIPLMLITLADAGKFIGDGLRYFKQRGRILGLSSQVDAFFGRSRPLPVSLLLLLMIAYMVVGAILLHSYENWSFIEAFYWAFISMSSIGFGDIVPERREMYPITIAYILVGLALASMCIDTSAAYYIRKIHFFGRKMKSAQATVTDLIKLSMFLKKRYRLSDKEMNEMSLESALKHMLAACEAYEPEDINHIFYIDHPLGSSHQTNNVDALNLQVIDDGPVDCV
ncbi:hypothetical protein AB6A40_000568 [Gnathostoma spinigerum]|uniref:Potassium channel domain-containing protein n=1 Tax=Gnathostoma spinigerum TaxID=75299 RepID=A0ABD6E2D5_9BILA